ITSGVEDRGWRITPLSSPAPILNSLSHPCLCLKYCTARSCFSAASRVAKVPRFRRLPVRGSSFLEYRRYSPDLSFRIIAVLHFFGFASAAECMSRGPRWGASGSALSLALQHFAELGPGPRISHVGGLQARTACLVDTKLQEAEFLDRMGVRID